MLIDNKKLYHLLIPAIPLFLSSDSSIESNDELPVSIRIMDMYGRIINQYSTNPGISTKRVGNNLLPGMYFAEVSQGKERKLVKLVKL